MSKKYTYLFKIFILMPKKYSYNNNIVYWNNTYRDSYSEGPVGLWPQGFHHLKII